MMGTLHKLSDYKLLDFVDMDEKDARACLGKVDTEAFLKNPTNALHNAGLITKPGVTFKIIKNESELTDLPSNVYPILIPEKLSAADLDRVVGGSTQADWDNGVKIMHDYFW